MKLINADELMDILHTWIEAADDEYDMEEHNRIGAFNEVLAAIRSLKPVSPEPCTNSISRQAVMDGFEQFKFAKFAYHAVRDYVAQLPPVTPQPNKWIPVNQPPKASGRYIVTTRFLKHSQIEIADYATDLHKVDEYDFPKHEAGWYNYDSEYGHYAIDNVIAWMPLPLPYKQEVEE